MKAGFAKVDITPSVGAKMGGYRARANGATGVHDPLFSRTLVLEHGGGVWALVSVEVLALSAEFLADVRESVASATPIAADHVLIAATHTHSGPSTIRTFFNADEILDANYMERLARSVIQSVSEALRSRFEARIGVGYSAVAGLGVNRRDPEHGSVDREASIIRIDDLRGEIKGVVVVYGCHPTSLGVENLLITADYPAETIRSIEATVGSGASAMFFAGALGDVSIGHSSELSAIGLQTPNRTFRHAAELGEKLAVAALSELPKISTSADAVIAMVSLPIEIEGRRYPGIEQLESDLAEAQRSLKAADKRDADALRRLLIEELYASIRCNNARKLDSLGGRVPFELCGLRIGDALFLGVPGEIFAETGLAMRNRREGKVAVIGLANGYVGYIPSTRAYSHGGYEVEATCCAGGTEQRILDAVDRVHRKLFGADPFQERNVAKVGLTRDERG